jgi:membrane-bound serine protease (ClpP class)
MIKLFRTIVLFLAIPFSLLAVDSPITSILEVEVSSSINPATLSYLEAAHQKAIKENHGVILLKLNTPGGLVTTTKDILTLIGESDIPWIVWITPEGASATSAGAIIASGAHLLYMSEGTNIGAATPIQMGKDIDKESDMRKKAVNDLVALVQSLSETRGRNAKLFGEMIEKASSFKSKEAKEKNLINGIANTQSELIKAMENSPLRMKGKDYQLKMINPSFVKMPMDLGQELLNVFADPSTAYVLFLIGAALIYLEFQAAGGFIAGGLGAFFLLLAGIGFQVLPLNFGALGLMVLSFILFVMEAFITSYGILSIAGLASLITGSLFLFRTDDAYLSISTSFILAVVAAIASFLGLCLYFILKERKNIGKEKFNAPSEKPGTIVKFLKKENDLNLYQAKFGGEFWNVLSHDDLEKGDQVKALEQEPGSMNLKVKKI